VAVEGAVVEGADSADELEEVEEVEEDLGVEELLADGAGIDLEAVLGDVALETDLVDEPANES
jgi:hypothetical protein